MNRTAHPSVCRMRLKFDLRTVAEAAAFGAAAAVALQPDSVGRRKAAKACLDALRVLLRH